MGDNGYHLQRGKGMICNYCEGSPNLPLHAKVLMDTSCDIFIMGNDLIVLSKDHNKIKRVDIEINYCPKCGKNLQREKGMICNQLVTPNKEGESNE